MSMRLQKYLARSGIASRRASEQLIVDGRVSINGAVVTELGTKVEPGVDTVCVDGELVTIAQMSATIVLNKPIGYVTTMDDPQNRQCVSDLIPLDEYPSLYPIGRLDKDTSGVLLFSTDGALGNELLHPSHHVDKTYRVEVRGVPNSHELSRLRSGIDIDGDGRLTSPAKVEIVSVSKSKKSCVLSISIHEGRNRQVRKMCKGVGHEVISLHRESFGPVTCENLKPGQWRVLTDAEVETLRSSVRSTEKTPNRTIVPAYLRFDDTSPCNQINHKSLQGSITVPGDKSIAHRALFLAAMADGVSRFEGVPQSKDIQSTMSVLSCLGADIQCDGDSVSVTGWGSEKSPISGLSLDCGNSATTARFLMGMLSGYQGTWTLTGDTSLSKRPMSHIAEPLTEMGARLDLTDGCLPCVVHGTTTLRGICFVPEHPTAQAKTAVVLAGLHAQRKTEIVESIQTRSHTEELLPCFGVSILSTKPSVSLCGPCKLEATHLSIPGDPSSAAFLLVAAALLANSRVKISGASNSQQRLGFVSALRYAGVNIEVHPPAGNSPVGTCDIELQTPADLAYRPFTLAAKDIPSCIDEIPVLALFAAHCDGESVLFGVEELRVKECDRLAAIVEGLSALGYLAWVEKHDSSQKHDSAQEDLHIIGKPFDNDKSFNNGKLFDNDKQAVGPSGPGRRHPNKSSFPNDSTSYDEALSRPEVSLHAHGDHRMAMVWFLAGFCGKMPVRVYGLDSISVSYPTFIDDIERLLT